ncbi:MAG: L-2-amino-thiazoline-4-carboxylic acid hydrolase [Pseudomonadota bacterium]
MSDPMQSPIFAQRRVEANILKHVYETVKDSEGEAAARSIVANAVRRASIAQAEEMAEGVETSMESFQDIYELWTRGGALEYEILDATETTFDFDVTRCRYAEMYREMGLGEIGHLLSCQRDGTFCEGYDPRIKMTRTQTIMQGADRCTFRYRFEENELVKGA